MLDRVAESISRYSMFAPGHRVGVAVSGGADSVCLLHVLRELAPRWNLTLTVLHLNHQLRGLESDDDMRFVEELSRGLSIVCRAESRDIASLAAATGDNLEQAAREARREFFLRFMREGELDRVALGHTRSDQAETVLFRLLRGAGAAGLAGMRPLTQEGLVRPLLALDRSDITAWLSERGIGWREDSSNRDPGFARNRIRHELLPRLAQEWNPALPAVLAHTADLAAEEEEYWRDEIDRLEPELLTFKAGAVLFPASRVASLSPAVSRRLVRRAIERAKGDLRRIEFQHVEEVLALAAGSPGHGRLQIPGLDVFRSFDWLRLAKPVADGLVGRNYRIDLNPPCQVGVPGSNSMIALEVVEKPEPRALSGYNEGESDLDGELACGLLHLRNWRPGDQYRRPGRKQAEKVKELFQDSRVPLWERRSWPMIIQRDEILWVKRFGPADGYAATSSSRSVLRVREVVNLESH